MSMPSPDLWLIADQEMTGAERLLQHSLQRIEWERQERQTDRERIALEIERQIGGLTGLAQGLADLISSMDTDRHDNRSRRWQGQLEQLLAPLDSGLEHLRNLLVLLDQPLAAAVSTPQEQRQQQQREQLQQLLSRRQQQVIKLEAEVQDLRCQLFAQSTLKGDSGPVAKADQAAEASTDHTSTPSIFS